MSSFCGANTMRNPFGTPVQAKNSNPFMGSFSQQQRPQNPLEKESLFQFGDTAASRTKGAPPKAWISEIWQLHAVDIEPVELWQNARVEFLERIRPQQKADRAIAIGLNQSLKKSSDSGQKGPAQKPFLNALAMNDTHSFTRSGGLSPHFLA